MASAGKEVPDLVTKKAFKSSKENKKDDDSTEVPAIVTDDDEDDEDFTDSSREELIAKIKHLKKKNKELKKYLYDIRQKEREKMTAKIPTAAPRNEIMDFIPTDMYEDISDEELFEKCKNSSLKRLIGECLEVFYRRSELRECSLEGGVPKCLRNTEASAKFRLCQAVIERIKKYVKTKYSLMNESEFENEFKRGIVEKCNNAKKLKEHNIYKKI